MIKRKIPEASPPTDGVNAFVGRNTVFEGEIRFEGMCRIDGTYDGDILSGDSLVIGETGEVNGQINVNTLTVHGKVNGNITAKRRILIYAPGRIEGDIETPVLALTEGAIFQGTCKMESIRKRRDEKMSPAILAKDQPGETKEK